MRRLVACLTLGFVVLAAGASAQQNQPIYPVYDGFLKNPDGSYTLSFAYFSHNADTVTIAPGADQRVRARRPATACSRRRSSPGHWRFQCVMVVPPDFDGKMKWTLTYGGVTTGTSERMLQSNWNLFEREGGAALAKIDYAKVPKGVCLNQPPTVRVLGVTARPNNPPTLSVAVNEELNLFGSAHDEGLPRGKGLVVEWKMLKGPGHGEVHDSRIGENEGDLLGAGTLRARAERHGFRVHAAHAAQCESRLSRESQGPDLSPP